MRYGIEVSDEGLELRAGGYPTGSSERGGRSGGWLDRLRFELPLTMDLKLSSSSCSLWWNGLSLSLKERDELSLMGPRGRFAGLSRTTLAWARSWASAQHAGPVGPDDSCSSCWARFLSSCICEGGNALIFATNSCRSVSGSSSSICASTAMSEPVENRHSASCGADKLLFGNGSFPRQTIRARLCSFSVQVEFIWLEDEKGRVRTRKWSPLAHISCRIYAYSIFFFI